MIRLLLVHVKSWTLFDPRDCELGEGPYYDGRTGRVWWVDILASRILWRVFDGPDGERDSGEIAAPGHVGAAVPRRAGGLVACLPWGVAAVDEHGAWTELASYPTIHERLRSNDAKADPHGRLWLGTMSYEEGADDGTLYRLDPGSDEPVPVLPHVTVSNGLGWSSDGATMYYIDSPTQRIDAFEFDMATGSLGERRTFTTIDDGFPDGMCVDAEGAVWVAIWQGSRVQRHLPDGSLDRVLHLPVPNVTSCAFAGPDLATLVVTTVGQTYRFEIDDVRGLPADYYAG